MDPSQIERLFSETSQRLLGLARRMKRGFVIVDRWEQTEDVLQSALLRVHQSLSTVAVQDERHFYRLAALNIRRELIDVARHYGRRPEVRFDTVEELAKTDTDDPRRLADWADFHRAIDELPDELKEVTELIWYFEKPQSEIATMLDVDVRTVKRRWREARLRLSAAMQGEAPKNSEYGFGH